MRQRAAVIVSPYFPPSSLAGVHRARHLAKYLPDAGWRSIIVCVDEAFHEQPLDPGLATLVPEDTEIVRVPALPAGWTRLVGIGEISLRAWQPLRRALLGLLARRPVEAVLITGSPYYPMLLAPKIRRRHRVPVVLDFQDPWVSAWGAAQPALSKAGLSHRLATLLEPQALRAADFVTSVSDTQNTETAARYPWLDSSRMAAIPIGGDPDDFVALRTTAGPATAVELDSRFIHLSYVGTYWPRAEPAVRALLAALARLRAEAPGLAERLRLNFIGTGERAANGPSHPVAGLAEETRVGDLVREVPARVPYLAALGVLARSQGILLFGSDEPHYTASKIYPVLMSGRPYLSLFHRASSAHATLVAAGGGCALSFASGDDLRSLQGPLAEGLRSIATRPEAFGRPDPAAYAVYDARVIAARFAEIFDRLPGRPVF